jgi:prepilin peptidase CpaA
VPLPASSDAIGVAVVALAATTAALIDVRTGRIPNALTAATALLGLLLAAAGAGGTTVRGALIGGAVGLAVMTPGFVLGGTGAGDVKLMAALGTLLGPVATVWAFLVSAVAGGVLAVAHALRRQRLGKTMARAAKLAAAPVSTKAEIDADAPVTRFAYGPAVAVGAIAAAVWW